MRATTERHNFGSGDGDAEERAHIEWLLNEARDEADKRRRCDLFLEALQRARRAGALQLELQALSFAVIYNIGVGYASTLLPYYWPYFKGLGERLSGLKSPQETHFLLWAGERILYFAPEFWTIPRLELQRGMQEWTSATLVAGGYEPRAALRLELHHCLRMGLSDKADSVMQALKNNESRDDLTPGASLLPGETTGFSGRRATNFGCNAYAHQIRVLYHCSKGDAQSAWHDASYLVEGLSSCALAMCAVAPREALAVLLETLTRAGMHARAESVHRLGLPMVLTMPEAVGWLGHHLRYMVQCGSIEEAKRLLDPLLEGEDETSAAESTGATTPFQRFHFLRGAIEVLRATRPASPLIRTFFSEAADLASRFDTRNGSDAFTKLLR